MDDIAMMSEPEAKLSKMSDVPRNLGSLRVLT